MKNILFKFILVVLSLASFSFSEPLTPARNTKDIENTVEPEAKEYVKYVAQACDRYSNIYSVDPFLVLSIIKCESKFNRYAISHLGAAGLLQLMPVASKGKNSWVYFPGYMKTGQDARSKAIKYQKKAYDAFDDNNFDEAIKYEKLFDKYIETSGEFFRKYTDELRTKYLDTDIRFNAEFAIDRGVSILAQNLKARNGDIREAVSAYNAGLGSVRHYEGIPPIDETVIFQNRVMNKYKKYLEAVEKNKTKKKNK